MGKLTLLASPHQLEHVLDDLEPRFLGEPINFDLHTWSVEGLDCPADHAAQMMMVMVVGTDSVEAEVAIAVNAVQQSQLDEEIEGSKNGRAANR